MNQAFIVFLLCLISTSLNSASPASPRHDEEILPILLVDQVYPPGKISENNYYHLRGFPTFVELTEAGFNKLEKLRKYEYFAINFAANFSQVEKPQTFYTVNSKFFARPKKPGIYQPDYPPFDGSKYRSHDGGCFKHEPKLWNHLKKRLNGVYEGNICSWVCECDLDTDKKEGLGSLISLEGRLLSGQDKPLEQSGLYFGWKNFSQEMKGIVFVLDARSVSENYSEWELGIRDLDDEDVSALEKSDELKHMIR